jgi:hypothetical protein
MVTFRRTWLAAWLCSLMLAPTLLAGQPRWLTSAPSAVNSGSFVIRGQAEELELGDLGDLPNEGLLAGPANGTPGTESPEVSIEDLSDLGGPFQSQFPELSAADNPFYHGVETDRASFVPALSTATYGNVILESGYSYIANRQHLGSDHSVPELVIRYGVSDCFEARFGWNLEAGGGGSMVSPVQQEEGLVAPPKIRPSIVYVNRFMSGFKWRLFQQSGWLPTQIVIVEGYIPSYGDTKRKEVAATYAFGWEFAPRWNLNGSLRYATESERNDDWGTWSPAIVLKAPLAERWTGQLEAFGIIPQGQARGLPQYNIGPGVQVLVTPAIQLNLRAGTGLNSVSPQFYLSAGFGVAF